MQRELVKYTKDDITEIIFVKNDLRGFVLFLQKREAFFLLFWNIGGCILREVML